MAINYARQFNRRITPQSQPIPGSNQVRNSGGGFSWEVDDWTRLDRFLILGAEGGTYYITERDLVKQNHEAIVRCIKANGVRAVNRIVEISDAGRAPKNDPAIFALALAVTHGDAQAKAHAFASLNKVCRIGTHLFHFAEYVNAMRGWGRGLRNAVGDWYVYRGADDLAHQAVKYQQRDGWSHGDLLRLAQGHGDKGALKWSPVSAVVDALDEAFYATFQNVEPRNKPVLLALDVSGSMAGSMIAGSCISGSLRRHAWRWRTGHHPRKPLAAHETG
jgi:60 kDa SS-A/Ro ribonucleoprotein